MHEQFYQMKEWMRIAASRLRVHLYRLCGGRDIHPTCLFGRGVRVERPWNVCLGQRCTLQPSVWLNVGSETARLEIGEFTFVGRGSEIEVSEHVTIGRGGLIAPGVFITDHNHGLRPDCPMFQQPCVAAPVTIGDDVWLGANCVVLPGVTIGSGAVVAAGAVVSRDVQPMAVVGGVPARLIRMRQP